MRHALWVHLHLHFGCRQSLVVYNAELFQTESQSTATDCINDQWKFWRIYLPVRRPLFVICSSSALETEELGFVAEVGTEVEVRRAVDAAVVKHNFFSVARSSNNGLQVFRAEVNATEENLFCSPSCCLRERFDVEIRLYSSAVIYTIIDCKQFEMGGSAVVEETVEIFVCDCAWNVIDPNFIEIG